MQIAAYDDVKVNRKEREVPTGTAWRTVFHEPDPNDPESPHAFLVEGTPGRVIKPHYHGGDQYQVVVYGNGLMGKHELPSFGVHFSRGHTPYGPILFGDKGLGFLTLRPKRDVGAQYLDIPENRAKLDAIPDRNPWQTTEGPVFEKPAPGGAAMHAFETIRDDRGLASYTVTLAPNARAKAPDATHTNGQYLIVAKGSLVYEGKEYKALSIAWVKPQEGAVELVAGAEGLELLALNFPLSTPKPAAAAAAPKGVPGTRVWQCALCSFTYDEAKGMPEEGIAPGTPWEDVPDTWTCPDCSASKSDFEMSVVG